MSVGTPAPPYTIGVDTGGTFTDLVLIDANGRLFIDKAFSTPAAPDRAVLDVLQRLSSATGLGIGDILKNTTRFAHGTTVSTNALIQRKGAVVGLLTTAGFEDTLAIARGPVGRTGGLPPSKAVDFLHNEPPPPLVPKNRIRGIGERIAPDGAVIAEPDPARIATAVRELMDEGIDSLAVCFLWSFRYPAHEIAVRDAVHAIAPDLPVSLSSEIAPRMGEFERMVTTVINAFIGPVTEDYISALQADLAAQGLRQPIQVMKSSGGLTLPEFVADETVSIVNSGPIGGLIAARSLGRSMDRRNLITADMGGTSFDVGLISDDEIEEERAPFLDQGLPVQITSRKIITIGAGGGSIAWSDGYRLHVGPESAGADPGPVCYGRGGTQPTVTDALVALGIIDPAQFFGGSYRLDADAARTAIRETIADPLGLEEMDAAAGIFDLVTARMADLIRKVTVESGNDPRDFTLVAYGGAGGAHAAAYAQQLGIGEVIVPFAAPAFSALGVGLSDVLFTYARSDPMPVDDASGDAAAAIYADLTARARVDLAAGNLGLEEVDLRRRVEMRYRGQMNEVTIDWPEDGSDIAAALTDAFEAHYMRRFGAGTVRRQTPLELISFRLEAVRPTVTPPPGRFPEGPETSKTARPVYLRGTGWTDAAIHAFGTLSLDDVVQGPAVVERDTTTIWLPPGASARRDEAGNLLIDPGERAS